MSPELRQRIIKQATPLFFCNGIKAITMDMIASQLGISKRTLYENFEDKTELLLACMQSVDNRRKERVAEFYRQKKNVLEMLLNIYKDILFLMRNASPMFFRDLERFHPRVNERYEYEKERRKQATMELLEQGVEEGMIRPEINKDIIASLLITQFELMKKSDQIFESKYTFTEIFETVFKSLLRGISTADGVEFIDNFFKENK